MIQKLFIILPLLLLFSDSYIYRMFISRLAVSPAIKVLYWVPTTLLLLALAYLMLFGGGDFVTHHARWFGWFIVILFLFLLPKRRRNPSQNGADTAEDDGKAMYRLVKKKPLSWADARRERFFVVFSPSSNRYACYKPAPER